MMDETRDLVFRIAAPGEAQAIATLGMLVVAPEFQRTGLGKRVLEAGEDAAQRSWRVRRMTMTVISVRKELIAYYERRGYRRTGEERPFPEDARHGTPRRDGLRFVLLEKDLSGTGGAPR